MTIANNSIPPPMAEYIATKFQYLPKLITLNLNQINTIQNCYYNTAIHSHQETKFYVNIRSLGSLQQLLLSKDNVIFIDGAPMDRHSFGLFAPSLPHLPHLTTLDLCISYIYIYITKLVCNSLYM